ncbi:apoptotic chromatin condensation inducer in the nucleus [Drosophila innubila]|uniref:apoptotic chromatin condensation inducer in the nucleus n=1 Tax=Drosophila innubila TaxID=198719 RepID=UPI00148C5819|nr:apoptotic chromatin condensation inducer in the nucleus [Drosophila innubila]
MRRRSERKKSSSPAPLPARRSRRSRKISENEKTEDEPLVEKVDDTKAPSKATSSIEEINEERGERASSEEHAASPVRKSRSTRTTPKKRNSTSSNQRDKSSERKVETIPEEIENGAEAIGDKSVDTDNNLSTEKESVKKTDEPPPDELQKEPEHTEEEKRPETPVKSKSKSQEEENSTEPTVAEDQHNDDTGKDPGLEKGKGSDDEGAKRSVEEVKVASSLSFTANKDEEHLKTTSDVLDIQTEDVEERKTERTLEKENTEKPKTDSIKASVKTDEEKEQKENHKESQEQSSDQPVNKEEASNDKHESVALQRSVRKRKWLSKKVVERAQPVLAITTDSLKNIISDVVNPVPLSDVQLESSSEEEGLVTSDHETDDRSLTPELRVTKERERERDEGNATDEEQQKPQPKQKQNDKDTPTAQASNKSAVEPATNAAVAVAVARSPSPARNRASHVLYITNLVRPFTVLQLKGLLARTGKIVEDDGFWIDRIKSKCYVAYATEDEAIETRHALHGVRWPVSNPKCLNVDFGSRTDMDRAIQSTKNETPKYPQDNTRDNQHAGNTWSRLDTSDKKPARPVREWDVGKKEPTDRDKSSNDRRRSSKERIDSRLRDSDRGKGADDADRSGQDRKRSRERDRGGRERERSDHGHGRSKSGSPALKSRKKENEPPIRLLDDLFRKTKGTPCIYWLPLTPEAIAEKEAFRQKRIEEHKQRIKEREERQKEREREKDRDRQRDSRRNRSNDRRRSRTRDRERRRY